MAKNAYKETRTFEVGTKEMFEYCLSALTEIGAKVQRRDANLGKIEATVGWHLFIGSPCRIEVKVMPAGPDQTEVSITSRSVISTQFDWGRNRRIVGKFRNMVDFIVQRAERIGAHHTIDAETV
jgi:hypothetical protein